MMIVLLSATWLNTNIKTEAVNAVVLSNIEALASNESGPGTIYDCYSSISSDGNGTMTHVTYCGTCEPILCRSWGTSNHCVLK